MIPSVGLFASGETDLLGPNPGMRGTGEQPETLGFVACQMYRDPDARPTSSHKPTPCRSSWRRWTMLWLPFQPYMELLV